MTGIINWFKTIFILEITGEIALKLVPPKYKEFIAFVICGALRATPAPRAA